MCNTSSQFSPIIFLIYSTVAVFTSIVVPMPLSIDLRKLNLHWHYSSQWNDSFFYSCDDDYVLIEEPLNGKSMKLCGNQIPKPFNVSSNELKIAFKSREHLGKSKPGFVATYTSGTTPGKMKALADFQNWLTAYFGFIAAVWDWLNILFERTCSFITIFGSYILLFASISTHWESW